MNALKSLNEFEKESNVMNSNELKNISGGVKRYNTIVTGKDGGDRQGICQEFIFNGTSYEPYGLSYTTGPAYAYP
jgi:hypothetical protein